MGIVGSIQFRAILVEGVIQPMESQIRQEKGENLPVLAATILTHLAPASLPTWMQRLELSHAGNVILGSAGNGEPAAGPSPSKGQGGTKGTAM